MVEAANPYAAPAVGSLEPSLGARSDISFAPYTADGMRKLYWWGLALSFLSGLGFILLLILHYRAWKMIQGIKPRTTPGKAVGFLFIPFFNFYWLFVSYRGLSIDMNRFNRETGLTSRVVSEGLGTAVCVLILFMIIPVVNWLVIIPYLICVFIWTHQVAYTAAAMIDATTPAKS